MPATTLTTYGKGGYDPDADDHNIVEVREVEIDPSVVTAEEKIVAALAVLDSRATVTDVVAALKSALG